MVRLCGYAVNRAKQTTGDDLSGWLQARVSEGLHAGQIAEVLGVSASAAHRWLRKLGLNRDRSEANALAWKLGHFSRESASSRAHETGFRFASVGRPSPWKGEHLPESWRDNISRGQVGQKVGANHPMWRGGGSMKYGPGWKRAKRLALRRAGGRCQTCNIDDTDLTEPLHVHHKIPVRCFASPPEAHNNSNLIVLCRTCHSLAERMADETLPLFLPAGRRTQRV
jgi:5-methylcytosine-specific restriction endonuclease McrA